MTCTRNHARLQTSINESALNDIFINGVNPSIFYSFQKYWASNLQADLTKFAFNAQMLLAIQKRSTKPPHAGNQIATAKHFGKRTCHNKTANVVDGKSTT